jgi:formate--tetrahydrofolate ligase
VEDKIFTVASEIYGAVSIDYQPLARRNLDLINRYGFDKLRFASPKPSSPSRTTRTSSAFQGFYRHRAGDQNRLGAGFLIPITGEILRMPGLSKAPAAFNIDIDDEGHITGVSSPARWPPCSETWKRQWTNRQN